MANAHYFYLPLSLAELEKKVSEHQEDFDDYLTETFNEDELQSFETKLDAIAAVFVQPIFEELTFEDFYADPALERQQRELFARCASSICLENLPDFQTNPFQVSWLLMLLEKFGEVLIDRGGVEELVLKDAYVEELKKHKSIETFISSPLERPVEVKTTRPVFPIDFLIQDVYRELDRLRDQHRIYEAIEQSETLGDKARKVFDVMVKEKLSPEALLRKSGLSPKDFDDNLEKLKFFLRKI